METAPFEVELTVAHTWDGEAIPAEERVKLRVRCGASHLEIWLDAPWHGDPAPAALAGSTDQLWEYEVVELMLLGDQERYLEIELGPAGHWLMLTLKGVRNVIQSGLPLRYEAQIQQGRWQGKATIDAIWLPPGLRALNAFSIHGSGSARRYLALSPPGGEYPDFHRLQAFVPIASLSSPESESGTPD